MKKIWSIACQIPGFIDYVPTEWNKRPSIRERMYFWGVLSTIKPEFVEALIADCHGQRVKLKMARNEEPPREVEVHQDWVQLLLKHPQFPGRFHPSNFLIFFSI